MSICRPRWLQSCSKTLVSTTRKEFCCASDWTFPSHVFMCALALAAALALTFVCNRKSRDNKTGMGHVKRWHVTPRTSSSRMTSLHPCTNSWKKPMVRACLFVLARHQLFRLNYLFHNELPDLFEVFELPRCCMFSRLLRHISVLLTRSRSCRHCFAGAGFFPLACS